MSSSNLGTTQQREAVNNRPRPIGGGVGDFEPEGEYNESKPQPALAELDPTTQSGSHLGTIFFDQIVELKISNQPVSSAAEVSKFTDQWVPITPALAEFAGKAAETTGKIATSLAKDTLSSGLDLLGQVMGVGSEPEKKQTSKPDTKPQNVLSTPRYEVEKSVITDKSVVSVNGKFETIEHVCKALGLSGLYLGVADENGNVHQYHATAAEKAENDQAKQAATAAAREKALAVATKTGKAGGPSDWNKQGELSVNSTQQATG